MPTTLSDIRFLIEREVKDSLENEDIINWCNQVNMDVGVVINVPSATPQTIVLDAKKLNYALPADLKLINGIRLKSDIDAGIDNPLSLHYRLYNGEIIFQKVFWAVPESLVIDYFKNMKYFTSISDPIDIDARFTPLYIFFCKMKYHNEVKPAANVHWRVAINSVSMMMNNYNAMRKQVISYYSLGTDPVVVKERW